MRRTRLCVLMALAAAMHAAAWGAAGRIVVGLSDQRLEENRSTVEAPYPEAFERVGYAPLIIPCTTNATALEAALDRIDLLVLTGGADVEPARYGARRIATCGEPDPWRDDFELQLVALARRRRMPIVGICRGMQILNVAFGGTLWQDIPSEWKCTTNVNHGTGSYLKPRDFPAAHTVRLEAGSRLAAAIGTADLAVNSHHHQAVKKLAPGFRIVARAPDGVIEAIEGDDYPAFGVQFHPESLVARAEGSSAYDLPRLTQLLRALPKLAAVRTMGTAEDVAEIVVDTNRFATADVAAELQKIIDANPNRTISLPDGTYLLARAIRTPAHPKKSVTLRLAAFAVLKAAPGWTKGEPLVRLGATHPANDIMTVGSNYSFEGGVLDGSGVADGLSIDGGRETHVRDVSIKGTRIGLRIRYGANNGSSDADVDHVNIVCNSALDSIGALVEGYDNSLTKMRICGAHTGVRLVGGGNTLRDVHPLFRMAKEISDADYRTSVAFDDIGGGNVYDYCYSDQLATGFRIAANRRSQYDRCFAGWYSPRGGREVGFECLGRFESRVRDFRIDFHGASIAASNRVLVVAQSGGKGVFDPPVLSGPHVE